MSFSEIQIIAAFVLPGFVATMITEIPEEAPPSSDLVKGARSLVYGIFVFCMVKGISKISPIELFWPMGSGLQPHLYTYLLLFLGGGIQGLGVIAFKKHILKRWLLPWIDPSR